jgi:predicted outer membrane repeat protein
MAIIRGSLFRKEKYVATWRNPPWHRLSLAFQHLRVRSPRPVLRAAATLLAIGLFALAAGCKPAGGITLVVNSNGDEGDSSPGDGYCRTGSSLTNCTLRAAIEESNAHPGADTINFNLPAGNTTIAVPAELPWIDGNLILDGTTQPGFIDEPLVRLEWVPSFSPPIRGLETPDVHLVITIRGLTIQGFPGVGIYNRSTLTLEKMHLLDNDDDGIQCVTPGSNLLTINDSVISGNRRGLAIQDCPTELNRSIVEHNNDTGIQQFGGTLTVSESFIRNNPGGIYASGSDLYTTQSISVLNSTIEDNHSPEHGGGIWVSDLIATDLTIRDSVISGNTAEGSGGGVYIEGGSLDISGTTLAGNSAQDRGGGLFAHNLTAVTIAASSFSGNSALNQGGGIYGDELASATIAGSTINGNTAGVSGGGLFLSGVPFSTLKAANSTISGNNAGTNGGGVWGEGGILELSFVTITGNSATIAGGIVNNGAINVLNSIVADNIGHNCFSQDPPASFGFNLDDDSSCLFAGYGDISGSPALLGPLQNNGGSTLTHALLPGSPAIDAASTSNCPHTDQRGVSRPQGAYCDMGAFESENPVTPQPAKKTLTPTGAVKGYTFDPVEFSPATISRNSPCGPTQVTVRVRISPTDRLASVGLFLRLEEKEGSRTTAWSSGASMKSMGDGWYQVTINTGSLPDTPEWSQDALLAVQFVVYGSGDEVLARSPVFRQVTVLQCQAPGKTATPTRRPVG